MSACGEGLDMGVSAGQVCECGENKTWTWEWCGHGEGMDVSACGVWMLVWVRRRAERSLQGCEIK